MNSSVYNHKLALNTQKLPVFSACLTMMLGLKCIGGIPVASRHVALVSGV